MGAQSCNRLNHLLIKAKHSPTSETILNPHILNNESYKVFYLESSNKRQNKKHPLTKYHNKDDKTKYHHKEDKIKLSL